MFLKRLSLRRRCLVSKFSKSSEARQCIRDVSERIQKIEKYLANNREADSFEKMCMKANVGASSTFTGTRFIYNLVFIVLIHALIMIV
jgi:hypothetical protein